MVTTAQPRLLDHVVSAHQFDRDLLEHVVARAAALDGVRDRRLDGLQRVDGRAEAVVVVLANATVA